VTITAVRVTADLRVAHVYFRTLTVEAAPREALKALARALPFLRSGLGRTLGMRVTPELRFEYDTTPDSARRVDALLDEVRRDPQKDRDRDREGES
jgi:ribosome-binding factor A